MSKTTEKFTRLKRICDILDIDRFPDATVLEDGVIALHRPDVAKYAYDIEANAPLEPAQIDSLREWAREDCFELFSDLFSICNGLIIGRSKFGVFGLHGDGYRNMIDSYLRQPINILTPNATRIGANLVDVDLIVGFGYRYHGEKETEYQHVIRGREGVFVFQKALKDDAPRFYPTVREWLITETNIALSQLQPLQ